VPHTVVIRGGAFEGLSAARTLGSSNAAMTVIDRRTFHLLQSLVDQGANGSLCNKQELNPALVDFLRAALQAVSPNTQRSYQSCRS
jgi:NADH dehydrogenase FAD-containing subunit